jgi:hypothetical protein
MSQTNDTANALPANLKAELENFDAAWKKKTDAAILDREARGGDYAASLELKSAEKWNEGHIGAALQNAGAAWVATQVHGVEQAATAVKEGVSGAVEGVENKAKSMWASALGAVEGVASSISTGVSDAVASVRNGAASGLHGAASELEAAAASIKTHATASESIKPGAQPVALPTPKAAGGRDAPEISI